MLSIYDIAYLARGSVDSPAEIRKTKKYIANGIRNQMEGKGFSLIEVLSPCPTNWNVSPLDAIEHISSTVKDIFPLGEFVKDGVRL